MKQAFDFRRSAWLIPLVIFLLAFAVRMIFFVQVKGSPYWRVPLVDAAGYDSDAQELLKTHWLSPLPTEKNPETPYFMPPFYSMFLAMLYLVFGHSVITVLLIQFVMGSITCVLTYFIGRRLVGIQVGSVAGIACGLCASQIFNDGRLLSTAFVTLLGLTVVLLAIKQVQSPVTWRWLVIGSLLGISAITRPNTMLLAPALVIWMWLERKSVLPTRASFWTLVMLTAFVLPIGVIAARNRVIGHDNVIICSNGGVNFFIGNYPDMEKTLGLRPGGKWYKLIEIPVRKGITKPSETSAYFVKTALGMMMKYKRLALWNFARKFVWIWRGQEVRRNEDDYYLTRVSPLYRALLWRKGSFGFPFGIIAPLALLGMVMSLRKRELFLLYAYVITQAAVLVVYFPSSRYRAPLMPVFLIFGAVAVFELGKLIRRKQWPDLIPLVLLLAAFGGLTTLWPPKFEGTPTQIEAENHRYLGMAYYKEKSVDQSIEEYNKCLALTPDDSEADMMLMIEYSGKGDLVDAERYGESFIRLEPDSVFGYESLGQIYNMQGRYADAEKMRNMIESSRPIAGWDLQESQ